MSKAQTLFYFFSTPKISSLIFQIHFNVQPQTPMVTTNKYFFSTKDFFRIINKPNVFFSGIIYSFFSIVFRGKFCYLFGSRLFTSQIFLSKKCFFRPFISIFRISKFFFKIFFFVRSVFFYKIHFI
jgi:hypothetical protein